MIVGIILNELASLISLQPAPKLLQYWKWWWSSGGVVGEWCGSKSLISVKGVIS